MGMRNGPLLTFEHCEQVFCHQFGYGLTVTADKEEPIDIGMQFVKSGHYQEAITFLDELVETYQMRHPILFTAGQMSMMASAGLYAFHLPAFTCPSLHSAIALCIRHCAVRFAACMAKTMLERTVLER